MAGAGYKLFQTGDVLTAAQVNTYLNEQTVMVFANAAARTSALTSVLAEGMMSYLQDTNSVEVYNGSSWVNVGNAGDITEVQAGVGISIASGTGPIPVITNSSTDLITTAGDLLYGTAADTVARLGIGTAGQVLKVNSGATAPEWGAASSGGGMTLLTTSNFPTSGSATHTISSISTSYKRLYILVKGVKSGSGGGVANWTMRVNSDTGANYGLNKTGTFTGGSYGDTSWNINARLFNSNDAFRQNYAIIDIPRYADTDARYASIVTYGIDENTTPFGQWSSAVYKGSSAISSITFDAGANYAGGTAYVYGVD
jgi:hypothetical protein